MNANTRLRLWKEARALLPMWAAVAVWIAAPFLLSVNDPLPYAFTGFLFGCAVLGPVSVGHEFTHRTMDMLLAQPVPRRQLWREKLAVLGAALLGLSLLLILTIQLNSTTGLEEVIRRAAEDDPLRVALFVAVPVIVPLMGFCSGPPFALFARNSLGGAALVFVVPCFLMVAGIILTKGLTDFAPAVEERLLLSYALLVGAVYSGVMFLDGCRRFERFEDVNLLGQELAPPRQLSALFSCLTRHTVPGRHPTANLLRKELRLQQPAFLVAAFLVALWLTFIFVWKVHPPVGAEILIVPSILLALGIPVTVGIVSTAEERNLGVHEWHLMLPVSARRQWCVKVIVALGVNMVLGILLPGLIGMASSWLVGGERLPEVKEGDAWAFLTSNLVIYCAALYASSASANSMRALIGTIVLIVTGGITLTLSISAASWFAKAIDHSPAPMRAGWWPAPEYLQCLHEMIWPWGVHGALLMLLVFGLENYRRTLDTIWRPVRHVVTLFAVISVLMAYASAWGILRVNYEGAYYELFRGRK